MIGRGGKNIQFSEDPEAAAEEDHPEARKAIREWFLAAQPRLRACYQRELRGNPWLHGAVVLKFEIEADLESMKMDRVRVFETSLFNEKVEACVVEAVGGMTFPHLESLDKAYVTYPVVFRREATSGASWRKTRKRGKTD